MDISSCLTEYLTLFPKGYCEKFTSCINRPWNALSYNSLVDHLYINNAGLINDICYKLWKNLQN